VAPQPKPPTKVELDYQYRVHRSVLLSSAYNTTVRWGVLGFLGWCVVLCIRALSGQTTVAQFLVTLLGNVTISKWAAYALTGCSVGYGWREHKLRLKVNETLGDRNSKLEKQVDPQRSSSKLTRRGETDPRDSI
jgi:hypothetical protein